MRVSIFGKIPCEAEPEPELCLSLVTNEHSGRVQVIAVNPVTGVKLDGGVLIQFLDDGTFTRALQVRAPGAGLQLDGDGRLIEETGYSS